MGEIKKKKRKKEWRKEEEKILDRSSIFDEIPKLKGERVAFDVAHGYKSEMVACGRLSGQAERKRALRLHLLPVNLETTPSLPRVELCWR